MIVRCHLRVIRGRRSLRELAEQAGVNRGTLSLIERGRLLPTEQQIERLAAVYGCPVEQWYPPRVLLAVIGDDE